MASGLSFLETASSTFIALAGPPETSERRLNFSQAFNPLGSIAGALIGTTFILSGVELNAGKIARLQALGQYQSYLHFETLRVVRPYLVLGVIVLAVAFMIWRTKFPVLQDDRHDDESPALPDKGSLGRVLRNRHLVLSVATMFFYIGAQVGTWSYFIQYVQEYAGQTEKIAGYFLTGTLVMFGLGRFASVVLMKYIAPARLMGTYSVVNVVLMALAVAHPGWAGVWMIFLTSFFMSLMYPTIFALGLHGLGQDSKVGGSMLVMSIVGGAVLTPVMGVIADASRSVAPAYSVPLFGFVVTACYAFLAQGRVELAALKPMH
jgi:FHS family L-fucose permease-like MFS transporter